ncbi:prolyl oligopeptidase family serine peptidase [Aquimarina sp. MMG016]|uniref:alpha/beta hydrolase family protein n=1 Tax=Aquimarina sp. MMG016 TaxID=2822690 RepID=UPI001B3A4F7E|nr:prolyl oligopeptidase family serine peptidase [Aquimarina sp. MMG016]MBQ4819398.1 S9 family peptidase [Aquimarina sp. MMG016]
MSRVFTIFFICVSLTSIAQKKVISHNDYDLWKEVKDVKISHLGKLVVTTVETDTGRGDGLIEIYNTETKQKFSFINGYDTSISYDEKYVVFKRKPLYEYIRKEKKKKVKKEDLTKDDLFIYDVENNNIYDSISRVKNYKLPKRGKDLLVIEKFKNKKLKDTSKSKKKDLSKAFKQNYALIYTLQTKKKDTIHQIKDFVIPENGERLYYTTSTKDRPKKGAKAKARDIGIYQYDLKSGLQKVIDTGKYIYDKLATNKEGNLFSYISITDSTAVDSLRYELHFYENNVSRKLLDTSGNNLKNGWILSGDQSPEFSENGNRLYFYSKPYKEYQRDTTLLEEEIPQVDIWNWQDKMIQPEQKSKYEQLSKEAFMSYFDIEKNSYVHLQEKSIQEIIFDEFKEQQFVIGATGLPYDIKRSWEIPWTKDYYIINTLTGQKRLALENAAMQPLLSPDGKYALYFDIYEQGWFSLNLNTAKKINLTKNIKQAFYDEDDDHPALPYPYGFGGFDKQGNALVYDKFDIWKLTLDGDSKPLNITKNGRKHKIIYRTRRLDNEKKNNASYIKDNLLITSFNETTKFSGLYVLENNKLIEKIKPNGFLIQSYKKAENTDRFVFTKQNFNTFPDIYTTENFENPIRITDLNPQQKDFKWGTAELFKWKAYDGIELEGIIYKPEDFNPSKKYPLITYFYEKSSDRLNRYSSPQPSASIVNPSYLVSNDYVMFVPDVVYKDGKPGPSAFNCIVSGVEALEKLGYIDSSNMSLQGQSWGGYQVAYLITVTNKFKAAMAGAPVSNMTSAYGGIRWQSGLSRAFQYEKSQSRIGKNLWEGFDLYIENSPLFGIPKIETPLLMMHNDKDGAVPYYQGIEMFMGMRRLQKPVWLLVYNDEAHNLKKVKNKQDLSIRMMQFFDHYLKGKPAPEWMTKGVSQVQKGKDFGYGMDKD